MQIKKKLITLCTTMAVLLSLFAPLGVIASNTSNQARYAPINISKITTKARANIKIETFNTTYYVDSYYKQLSNQQKRLYDALVGMPIQDNELRIALDTPITYTSVGEDLTDDEVNTALELVADVISPALYAFLWDKPLTFWIGFSDGTKTEGSFSSYGFDDAEYVYQSGKYHWNVSEILVDIKVADIYRSNPAGYVAQVSNKVAEFSTTSQSRYGKLKDIHDYLCRNVVYDLGATYAHEPYGALVQGKAVCEGYAEAFKLLCDKYNIPCALIVGVGNSEAHMWNYVQMENGYWYAVDVTWDDQSSIYYDFFLAGYNTTASHFGNKSFKQLHTEVDYSLSYPLIYSSAYVDPCAQGHKPGDWIITKEATYTAAGERVKKCTVCGEITATEVIPKLTLPTGGTLKETSKLKVENGYLSGIKEKVTVADLKKEFDGDILVLDSDGKALSSSSYVGTGCKVNMGSELVTIYIFGELTGDGIIESIDYLILKKIILGNISYTPEQLKASCVNGDPKPSSVDYYLVKKHILGNYNLFS
jgi:hypothetical protein